MTRGNQRELARQKNAKKDQAKKNKKEGDPRARLDHDAEVLRAKQAAADARKAEAQKAGMGKVTTY